MLRAVGVEGRMGGWMAGVVDAASWTAAAAAAEEKRREDNTLRSEESVGRSKRGTAR